MRVGSLMFAFFTRMAPITPERARRSTSSWCSSGTNPSKKSGT
jgi:hypothetical protein